MKKKQHAGHCCHLLPILLHFSTLIVDSTDFLDVIFMDLKYFQTTSFTYSVPLTRSTQQYTTSYACRFKKLYMDPYPPSVHLSVSPLRSIETVFHSNAHGDYYSQQFANLFQFSITILHNKRAHLTLNKYSHKIEIKHFVIFKDLSLLSSLTSFLSAFPCLPQKVETNSKVLIKLIYSNLMIVNFLVRSKLLNIDRFRV